MGGVIMMVLLCSVLPLFVLQGVVGAKLGGGESCFEEGVDYIGNDLQEGHYDSTSSAAECQKACQRTNGCEYWTWDPTYHTACWKKTAKGQTQANSKLSGRKVDHFNTHLCLCNGDQLLGSAKTIAQAMEEHRKPGSRVILTGDFNCDDGWENSKPVL